MVLFMKQGCKVCPFAPGAQHKREIEKLVFLCVDRAQSTAGKGLRGHYDSERAFLSAASIMLLLRRDRSRSMTFATGSKVAKSKEPQRRLGGGGAG